VAEIINIMDFAVDDTVPEFYVGPENHFMCVPDIPLGLMQQLSKFSKVKEQLAETGDLSVILEMFDQLLDDRSAALFRERVADRTIGIKRVMRIIPWIMEEYGLGHPTQPSSPSSSGSNDGETGPTSPDGVTPGVLMLGAPQPA
jgi:hypothetical protein